MEMKSLKLTRILKCSQEKAFQAWAYTHQMSQWMGPGDVKCEKIEADFTVGGAYEICMRTPDGLMTAYGEYKEIHPSDRLSFTWGWRENELEGSLVTLSFRPVDGGTELTLEHSNIPNEEIAQHHTVGWNGSLDKLTQFLS